jgi:PAS domain S-box-containing protein
MFRWVLLAQWAVGVVVTFALSGAGPSPHLWTASLLGGALCIGPLVLVARFPGAWPTRHVIAVTQLSFSALLIHVSDGRVETHFHVFASLAFLACYRDWKVLATATAIAVGDHFVRGAIWPHAVYGQPDPNWRLAIEHAGWMLFENCLLLLGISRSLKELRRIADREASLSEVHAQVERQVATRTAELAASREQFRELVESTRAVPWEFDPDERRTTYIAPQVESMLGYPVGRFEAPGFYRSVVHPDDVERIDLAMYRGLVLGQDFQEDVRLVASDGRVVHVRNVVAVVRKGDGLVLRGVMFDISHEKLLEAELREAQKRESLGRIAAGVAHGINTPLQYIGNNVEFLGLATSRLLTALEEVASLDGGADPRVVEIVRRAKLGMMQSRVPAAIAATQDGLHAVKRIVATLQNLNVEQGPTAPVVPVEIGGLLAAAIDTISADAPQIGIELGVDASVDAILGDPETLARALGGLVRNAVEACVESDREDPRVRILVTQRGHLVEIHVHDEGRGITTAVRERMFDPFYTTKGVGHGCGEGLHRIRAIIIGEHGGELFCERTSPAGTTFVVRLSAATITARVA